MTADVNEAPDPDSDEFLTEQNTVDKTTDPETSADEVGTDAELLSTDPTTTDDPK